MARSYPKHYWTLKFIGGELDGQEKRYPHCPTRWMHAGEEYRLVGREVGKLIAEFVKCK